ncbi:GNAT family N-acetyltransferase [Paenibacillus filicis]|uniref:GNAT family N-acetyltransferase n=1 Tax=Paenibacillus gyeongsangnamensis TaxID=3388067 RepID=A0ABT4QLD3_9BACL|nr:GNAT family N-acetyltransferase [Paenibacillus filicis]MCZ8517681.1 GNAT family N-acetyltransferase [Paenibacillus filicis]
MRRISLTMIRRDLLNIPQYSVPNKYKIRTYNKGEEHIWAAVEVSVNEFKDEAAALTRFGQEFGQHLDEMSLRCLFMENEHGEVIGTTTAWYGTLDEMETWGRIHWVGIKPAYQEKKLAKPLFSAALKILSRFHTKAYLTTQTTSYRAINMYLDYGFEAFITKTDCIEGWRLLENKLNRTILK